MTLAIFNHYVDRAMGVNKTELSSEQLGARHAGRKVPLIMQLARPKAKGGARYAKGRGRHAA